MSSTELLSVGQAAAIAGMHPNTIRQWTERGKLPCVRVAWRRVVLREVLARLSAEREVARAQ